MCWCLMRLMHQLEKGTNVKICVKYKLAYQVSIGLNQYLQYQIYPNQARPLK